MIRDSEGNELLYWPVVGLEAGEDSAHLIIRVDTPQAALLRANTDNRAKVMGRLNGTSDAFVDLALTPFDLNALAFPYTEFEVFVRATSAVTTFDRVPLTVGAASSGQAQWLGE